MSNIKNAIQDFNTFSEQDLKTLYSFYHVTTIPDLVFKIYKQGLLITDSTGIRPSNYEYSNIIPYHPLDYYGTKDKILGKGTYGSVKLYTGPNGTYAIKKLLLDDYEGVRSQYLREVAIMLRCKHPNIIPVNDIILKTRSPPVLNSNKLYIVMPAADTDLDQYIKNANLTLNIKKSIAFQILDAFTYLAERDILHRDLKPKNILVYSTLNSEPPKIQIADFGLAIPGGCINKTGMTALVYTLHYRPIELLAEDSPIGYGTSADIWSIGCVLYELYTGKVLWPGDNEQDMLFRILKTLGTTTPEEIKGIESIKSANLNKMLVKYKYDRNIQFIKTGVQDDQMTEIILECLRYNPVERPSAYHLMNNPYFKDFNKDSNPQYPETGLKSRCENSFLLREWYPSNGMLVRKEINKTMLHILQDWLIEVWRMFKLKDRTFFVTNFILDWIISKPEFNISKDNFQLIGSTAQWIASKFCEVFAPEANDYVYISDGKYSKEQMLEMEIKILKECNYDLIFSVSNDFKKAIDIFKDRDSSREGVLHILTLMAITFCNLRFSLLPSEQNTLALTISKLMNNPEGYIVPDNQTENVKKFREEFMKLTKRYTSLDKYALLRKNLGESFYDMLKKL